MEPEDFNQNNDSGQSNIEKAKATIVTYFLSYERFDEEVMAVNENEEDDWFYKID